MNVKNVSIVLAIVIGLFVFASCSKSEKTDATENNLKSDDKKTDKAESSEELLIVTTCPIMGGKADLEGESIVHKGYKVYFCCPGCDKKFQKDPDKYIKIIESNPEKYLK